jgi:hypothetical protein
MERESNGREVAKQILKTWYKTKHNYDTINNNIYPNCHDLLLLGKG